MKKLFLTGVLSAAMTFSTSAFAAVTYGTTDTLGVSYDSSKSTVSVTTDLSKYSGQMTVIVLDKDASAVNSSTILYIDQDAAPADSSATKIFQNMGLKKTNLPDGTYTVKVGSDDKTMENPLVGTIVISSDGEKISFVWGDVNNSGAADSSDAADILAIATGTVNEGVYTIGTPLNLSAGGKIVWGDVNDSGAADSSDAADILAIATGTVNEGSHVIGETVSVTVVK